MLRTRAPLILSGMDARILFGIGMGVVSLCLRWRFPVVPQALATFGAAIGVGLIAWALVDTVPLVHAASGIVAFALLSALLDWVLSRKPARVLNTGATIDQSITSHNQSGGITAGIVNFSPPERHLDDAICADLLKLVPKHRLVKVDSPLGDGEAFNFAAEIWDFLTVGGYRMDQEHVQTIKIPPTPAGIGLDIESDPDIASISVGPR